MAEFDRREAEKRDAERSKNDLEAYIISTGGTLENGAYDEVDIVASASPTCHDVKSLRHLKPHCMSNLDVTEF